MVIVSVRMKRTLQNLISKTNHEIKQFIIPPLRHFTILGQKNAQNIPRYYTVNRAKIRTEEERQNGHTKRTKEWWNNKSLIRWFNIQYERTFCSLLVFLLDPTGLGKILRNSQNIRAYYMLNHRIRCIYP